LEINKSGLVHQSLIVSLGVMLFLSIAIIFPIETLAAEKFTIEANINSGNIPNPDKLKVVAFANGDTQVQYIDDITKTKSKKIFIPFMFDKESDIVTVGYNDEYFVCAYNLDAKTDSMKSYSCNEGDIEDKDGTSTAKLDQFQSVDAESNKETENVKINILVPLADRKNIENIKVVTMDKGEFKSKEINAAELLKNSGGDTLQFSFNFDRKTEIGQIQEGDIYFACVSANELNPPEGTECEHKVTETIGQVNNLYAR
jgi:hypothetical protein